MRGAHSACSWARSKRRANLSQTAKFDETQKKTPLRPGTKGRLEIARVPSLLGQDVVSTRWQIPQSLPLPLPLLTTNGMLAVASPPSTVLPALRAQTATWNFGSELDGVQLNLLDVLQLLAMVQFLPS